MKYVYFVSFAYNTHTFNSFAFFNAETTLDEPITSINDIKMIEDEYDKGKRKSDKIYPRVINYILLRTEDASNE